MCYNDVNNFQMSTTFYQVKGDKMYYKRALQKKSEIEFILHLKGILSIYILKGLVIT